MTGGYLQSIVFFFMMMLFSYVHECAHMAAAVYFEDGHSATRSFMAGRGPFGNVMYMAPSLPFRCRMAVYMAGPAANVAMVGAAYVVREIVKAAGDASGSYGITFGAAGAITVNGFIEMIMMANIMLAAFNLLPFFPLDGGRAAVLLLSSITGYPAALKIGALFSCIFAVCVFISGLYLVQYNDMNIILSADAIYFLYILKGEIYGPY